MSAFDQIAATVGYATLVILAGCAALWAGLLIWWWFPAKAQFSRDLPTHLSTPYGPLRITLLTGVGSRRKARWFFGLMLVKDGEAPRAKVVSRKFSPTPGNEDV